MPGAWIGPQSSLGCLKDRSLLGDSVIGRPSCRSRQRRRSVKMLVLTNEDIEPLVNMGECIDSLEIAYGALGRRQAVDTPRQDGIVDDEGHAGAIYSLKTMAGSLPAV